MIHYNYRVTSLAAYDLDGDGALELVTGWSSGKVEVRSAKSGGYDINIYP